MLRKHPEIFVTLLISLFIAISFALFPEDSAYYDLLSRGLSDAHSHAVSERIYLSLLGITWKAGGSLAVHLATGLITFVGISLVLLAVLFIFQRIGSRSAGSMRRSIGNLKWLTFAVIAGMLARPAFGNWSTFMEDRRLFAPLDLLDYATKQKAKNIYYNPYTARYVIPLRPEWTGSDSDDSRKRASEDPAFWRSLDRKHRFDMVLLSGPPSEFQSLLDHLMASPDWSLVYFDNGGMAFSRQTAKDAGFSELENLAERFTSSKDKATALAQAAMQCVVIQNYELAESLLQKADSIDKQCIEVLLARATIDAHRKNWTGAIRHADEALAKKSTLLPALQIKAQAELENRDPEGAFSVSSEIIRLYPNDFYSLLQHARISNAVHAYQSEARALQKAGSIAEKSGISTGIYHLFLGQSYAKQGMSRQSLEEFEAALKDPTLSGDQKKDIQETMATIRLHAGMNQKN